MAFSHPAQESPSVTSAAFYSQDSHQDPPSFGRMGCRLHLSTQGCQGCGKQVRWGILLWPILENTMCHTPFKNISLHSHNPLNCLNISWCCLQPFSLPSHNKTQGFHAHTQTKNLPFPEEESVTLVCNVCCETITFCKRISCCPIFKEVILQPGTIKAKYCSGLSLRDPPFI